MHLPGKSFAVLNMVPKAAMEELLDDEVVEEFKNKLFTFKQGMDTNLCGQALLAAISLGVNRTNLIRKHYLDYQDLVQNEDTPVAASGAAQPVGGSLQTVAGEECLAQPASGIIPSGAAARLQTAGGTGSPIPANGTAPHSR